MDKIDTVYIIGAGFSKDCGYPLTSTLLSDLWARLPSKTRKDLLKVIQFHHPNFNQNKKKTFPNIETLLTEMDVNKEMFNMSRTQSGNFKIEDLHQLRDDLLIEIHKWFYELHNDAVEKSWLKKFSRHVKNENSVIISFNWDLLLDKELLKKNDSDNYGLNNGITCYPTLLKPHGSLNWYNSRDITGVKKAKKDIIFSSDEGAIGCFKPDRPIKSKSGKKYVPFIVPPTYLKEFEHPVFERIWRNCTHALSIANKIIFLGYSMPESDMQAKFILRCGFHNQLEGLPIAKNTRKRIKPDLASVVVVNPDSQAFERIKEIAGEKFECQWIHKEMHSWVEEDIS